MWLPQDFLFPCYNVNNGRYNSILRWKNTRNVIYEEQTGSVVPCLQFNRPHSRVLHTSWFILSVCFIQWFVVISMIQILKKPKCDLENPICTTELCKSINSSIVECEVCFIYSNDIDYGCGGIYLQDNCIFILTLLNSVGAVISRIVVGPLSDHYGIRYTYIMLLSISLIASILQGIFPTLVVYTALFNGIIGGSFILSVLWSIQMFDTPILGTVIGIVGGIGNFGGGLVYFINAYIYDACINNVDCAVDGICNNICLLWPSVIILFIIPYIYKFTDDCPYGTYQELKKYYADMNAQEQQQQEQQTYDQDIEINLDDTLHDSIVSLYETVPNITVGTVWKNLKNIKLLILSLGYLVSFGLEITLYSNFNIYIKQILNLSHKNSDLFSSIFGFITLVSRPFGGILTDKIFNSFGVSGRVKFASFTIISTGVVGLAFSLIITNCKNNILCIEQGEIYNDIILIVVIWSVCTNMAEGAIFGLLSYIDNRSVATNVSIIGTSGVVGAIIGNILFRTTGGYITFLTFGFLGVFTGFITAVAML